MTASSSLHLGNKVLCCELAVIAAIQEVDDKSQSQPPKEAQPGDDQQSSHERHAEHHGATSLASGWVATNVADQPNGFLISTRKPPLTHCASPLTPPRPPAPNPCGS